MPTIVSYHVVYYNLVSMNHLILVIHLDKSYFNYCIEMVKWSIIILLYACTDITITDSSVARGHELSILRHGKHFCQPQNNSLSYRIIIYVGVYVLCAIHLTREFTSVYPG